MSVKFYPSNSRLVRFIGYLWAGPNSLIGLTVGLIGLCTGGKVAAHRGCLEFHGGFVKWALDTVAGGAMAMTLGHTILGQSDRGLAFVRDHEQVHVRQYERWGPAFLPAYLLSSGYLWLRGRDMYRENPFEAEAFALSDPSKIRRTKRT
ncbi:MAG: hypothetical protein AAFN77_02260 [Planctomycetota bacterium]